MRWLLLSFTTLLILSTVHPVSAHIEKGNMPDSVAEMEYRILLEFKPEDTKTRSLLGMALLRQNKLKEAEQEFRTILRQDPDNFNSLDALGIIKTRQKEYDEALSTLQAAITINPSDPMVFFHLGLVLEKVNNPPEAMVALQTALDNLKTSQTTPAVKKSQKQEIEQALSRLQDKKTLD
ncbi:MAG: tetratricopeptide repeat protein [Proteobacteria bacterium]|nr:tetratricopeptide repeat protein [Pseudomonadota bacterium]MBU1688648.1 tetratricopeptide repeat protein [Pseudomonadota bacterium]